MTLHSYEARNSDRARPGRTDATTDQTRTPAARLRHTLRPGLFRRGLAVSAVTVGLSVGLLANPTGASADPAPQTVAQAKQQVAQLQQEAEAADQQYLTLKHELSDRESDLDEKKTDLKDQSAKVDRMRDRLTKVALAEFQNRGLNTRTRLFLTEDTTGFLNQMATVEKFSENQNTELQSFQTEQADLADLERSTEADIATLQEEKQRLDDLRSQADDKVQKAEDLLDELTEEERQLIEEEERRQEEAARQAAEEAEESFAIDQVDDEGNVTTTDDSSTGDSSTGDSSTDDSSTDDSGSETSSGQSSDSDDTAAAATSTSTGGSGSSSSGSSASSKGLQALAFAKDQLGKPYSFGAAGPDAYDCSGLTSAAWESAGVQLSRTSQTQINDGTRVSQGDLQPGDLVFFYGSSPSHVALYAGNGSIIHASRPGKPVEYSKIEYMPFSGAVRPG